MARSTRLWRAPLVAAACVATARAASAPAEPRAATDVRIPEPPALTLDQARQRMVSLINRDRATMGLTPVALDEGAPGRAGKAHAEDMASHGYLGHYGTDGSVPEERMTRAGGVDMVLENASCFTDEKTRRIDPQARIDARSIDEAESMFFNERPPHDGHRKNILKPWHTRVGIGVAQPAAVPGEIPSPCFAQEFVDSFGSYAPVPRTLRVGDTLHVEGTVNAPAKFAGVGLARVDLAGPLGVAEANRRRSYTVPAPYQTYWPAGFQTPIVVSVVGGRFAVDLPVSDGGKPGMYELSVWANVPRSADLVMVSLRTIQAR